MKNIIDYVSEEMALFSEKNFCPVDSLVLSQFSYVFFDGLVPGFGERKKPVKIKDLFLAENFHAMLDAVRDPESNKRLLTALAASPRFRETGVMFYANELDAETEKQFSAVTFLIGGKLLYIAFRGTDNTFVGWKEDFNMAFLDEIPSQARAVKYFEEVASLLSGKIILGGHSKGGNLAVYSGVKCRDALKRRISAIYDHDGPGFRDEFLKDPKFEKIKPLIKKTMPQSSIIGMLLEGHGEYRVVKSNRFGVMQHDPFSWSVAGNDFETLEGVSPAVDYMDKALRDWLSHISDSDRERFIDTLYNVLSASNATSVGDLQKLSSKDAAAIFSAIGSIDPETRKFLFDTIKNLVLASLGMKRQQEESEAMDRYISPLPKKGFSSDAGA